MTTTERQTIEVTYGLNYREAAAQVAALRAAQEGLTTQASSRLAPAIASVNEAAKNMASRLGPAAAAISSVSAALGAAGGEAGKFVASGGQVVAAWAAGGPVGAAIVAGTVLVDTLSQSWVKATAAQDAALDAMFASVNRQLTATRETKVALEQTRTALTAALRIGEDESITFQRSLEDARKAGAQRVEEAQARLDRLKATAVDLRQIEKDAETLDMTFQQARAWREDLRRKEIASAERALDNVRAQATIAPQVLVVERRRAEAAERKAAAEERFKAALDGQRTAYEALYRYRDVVEPPTVEDFETNTDELSRTMRGRRAIDGGGLGSAIEDAAKEAGALERKANDWLDRMREEAVAHRLETIKAANDKEIEDKKRTAEALLEVDRSYRDRSLEVLQGSVSTALAVGQAYLDAKIRGEKDAEAKAVASFLSATGQQLVAAGTRAVFEGAIISSNPLTPGAGVPMMVAGGAAIAVGVGMGAAGSAVSASLAGGGSSAVREPAIRDVNAPPAGRGAGGGGGITIIYQGASGATADETYRAVDSVNQKIQRRGLRRPR